MDILRLIIKEQETTKILEDNKITNNLTENEEHFTHLNEDTIIQWEVKDSILQY